MSIRDTIVETSPFYEIARERLSEFPTNSYTLPYTIEGHFRIIPETNAIDGFTNFHVVEETPMMLKIVSMAYFLESGLLPFEATFQTVMEGISYTALLSSEDSVWESWSEKKRWNAIYQYATERQEPQWNWDKPLVGLLNSSRSSP